MEGKPLKKRAPAKAAVKRRGGRRRITLHDLAEMAADIEAQAGILQRILMDFAEAYPRDHLDCMLPPAGRRQPQGLKPAKVVPGQPFCQGC